MIDDAFVFDSVAHVFNFKSKNAIGSPGLMFFNHLYAFHQALTPDSEVHLPPEEFLRQWTVDDVRRTVYEESDTDMLMAMPLPLTDLCKDGLSPWKECAELAGRTPTAPFSEAPNPRREPAAPARLDVEETKSRLGRRTR